MVEVSVSLVSLNQRKDLELLMPSLAAAADSLACEILLVDNRSEDGSSDFLREHYPRVNVLRNDDRAGYGENHNLNLARASGRYFLVMNTDMVIHDPAALLKLRDYMDAHADTGMTTLKIVNEDGTIQGLNKRYPTVFDLFIRGVLPRRWQPLFQSRMDRYEMRDVGYDDRCEVEFISGAFMFCRADVLRNIGGFDPEYFLYFEDADLCRRVQATHRTMYLPDATVTHFWQRGAHKSKTHRQYFIDSGRRYFRRWGLKVA